MGPCRLDQAAHLAEIGQRDRVDAARGHLVDRGDDVGIRRLRIVDIRQHGIDLGALRGDGAGQRAVILVRVELQAEAAAFQVEPRQHLGDAFRGRFFRRHLRLEPDLAQRPARLWAAGEFARRIERGNEFLLDTEPPHHLHQPAQAFARHQHQIVARRYDETHDPGLDRRRVGRVMDRKHRALQHVGALLGEQAGELRLLARFQDQDAVAVEPVSHDGALTNRVAGLFI